MPPVKVALIGAGSFVFGPSVLAQAILEHKLDDLHLVLMDLDAETVTLLAAVAQRMARETGTKTKITATTDRAAALDGADFVINSAARQIHKRFAMDLEVINRVYPDHLVTEFGGIQGLSYSLRQIALTQEITADIKRLCPKATLLNVANPLPRVCQAAQAEGVKTIGFCSATLDTYGCLWQLFTGERVDYPWTTPRRLWNLVMAGTNHFTFLVAMVDRACRENLLPQIPGKLATRSLGAPLAENLFRATGSLLFPNDGHTHDFLPPIAGSLGNRAAPTHGSPDERTARLELLRQIASGTASWDPLIAHPSWERPFDLIAALAFSRPAEFHALNLPNAGQIPQLPPDVFVETPARATSAGITPRTVNLPAPVVPYVASAAKVSDTITRAALRRSKRQLREAIDLDPTILDKTKGREALEACLTAHADILPKY